MLLFGIWHTWMLLDPCRASISLSTNASLRGFLKVLKGIRDAKHLAQRLSYKSSKRAMAVINYYYYFVLFWATSWRRQCISRCRRECKGVLSGKWSNMRKVYPKWRRRKSFKNRYELLLPPNSICQFTIPPEIVENCKGKKRVFFKNKFVFTLK